MSRQLSVKWNGREVHNPILRKLIIVVISVVVPIWLFVGILFLFMMVPIMLAIHPIFYLFGRVGTIRQEGYGNTSIKLDRDSFRRKK